MTPPASDAQIEERLESIFAHVEALRDVNVRVRSGVVRLEGTAATARAREKALELAESMEGVVYVEDRIEETEQVGERIEPVVERLGIWWRTFVARLPLIALALGVIVLFAVLARLLGRWEAPFRLVHRRRLVRGIIQQITATVVFLMGVVIALELVEATALVGAVVGAAGLAGLALGLAFRDIGENYLASILLGTQRPFSAGDHVVIDTHEGKVVRLTTRDTVLMTLEGNHLRLPNAAVYKAVILNYTRNPLRQLWFDVAIGTGVDLHEAQRLAMEALRDTPGVVPDPAPQARIEELGDWSVRVRVLAWIDQSRSDWFKVRSEAIRRLKSAFDANGIVMPVPTQLVEMAPGGRATAEEQRALGARELSEPAPEVRNDDVLERQMAAEVRRAEEKDLLTDGG